MRTKVFNQVFTVYENFGFTKAVDYLFTLIKADLICCEEGQAIMDEIMKVALDDEKKEAV